MAESRWTTFGTVTSLITSSQLDNTADDNGVYSAALNNITNRDLYVALRFSLSAQSSDRDTSVSPYVAIYQIGDLGDSTFEWDTSVAPPDDTWVANMQVDSGASVARVKHVYHVLLHPGQSKFYLKNKTSQPFTCCTKLEYAAYGVEAS